MTTASISKPSHSTPFSLSLALLNFGLINYLILNGVLVVGLPQVAESWFRNPWALLVTHLFTLGFVTSIIMGAMYQLVPVMLETKIWSQKLGYLHVALYTIGVCCLLIGFWTLSAPSLIIGGSLVWSGAVVFLINIAATMRTAAHWHHGATFLKFSLTYLIAVCTLGIILALNIHTGFLGASTRSHLGMHVVLGFGGWFTMTIMGMAYRLIPLFTLSHHTPGKLTQWALVLTNLGIIALIIALGLESSQAITLMAFGIGVAGVLIFLAEMHQIIRSRPRKELDLGMRFAVAAFLFLILTLVSAVVYTILPDQYLMPSHGVGLLYLGAMGWVSLMVIGHMYKIVPFLVWTARYGPKAGKEPVPLLRDMYGPSPATWAFRSLVTGIPLVVAGLWLDWIFIAQTGALMSTVGAALFGWGMFTVHRR